jgi:hypothetical protein
MSIGRLGIKTVFLAAGARRLERDFVGQQGTHAILLLNLFYRWSISPSSLAKGWPAHAQSRYGAEPGVFVTLIGRDYHLIRITKEVMFFQ